MKSSAKVVGFVFLLLPVLMSCASTKLTHVWKDEAYNGRPVADILVLGVTDEDAIRRTYESKFVESLREAGVEAEPSFPLLSGNYKLKKEEIVAAVKKVGADSVLITHLVRVDEKEIHTPSQTYVVPRYGGGYYGYYGRGYDYVHYPGYSRVEVKVVLETSLYNAADEKPMWSARSETIDPSSEEALIDSVISALVSDLKAKKLLAPKPKAK
ncbi:MAG: hypothetical protein JSU72_19480 [Deltaproteobacteria bacterium]|nr:MAG: hypothetical protein JSU72_19480 [Deltaproteobacteria bacterium]